MTKIAKSFPVSASSMMEAATKFAASKIKEGYEFDALYEYKDENDKIIWGRIRLSHPGTGKKWIRPIYLAEDGLYYASEPDFSRWGRKKPLYGLHLLAKYPDAHVWIVEGEKCVDKFNNFFEKQNIQHLHVAVTSGSATSADDADWRLLYA